MEQYKPICDIQFKYKKNQIKQPKINWVEFYIGLAFTISQKSPDGQTKHGCIITDEKNRPLGFGYNGFPRDVMDSVLPNLRPEKYPWMYHAEKNAIANCIHRPDNGIAYVTGKCCNDCLYSLYQNGINKIYIANRPGWTLDKEESIWFNEFVYLTGIAIYYVKPNLSWLLDLGKFVTEPNFYIDNPV